MLKLRREKGRRLLGVRIGWKECKRPTDTIGRRGVMGDAVLPIPARKVQGG